MEEEGGEGSGWREPVLLLGTHMHTHMHVQIPLGGDKWMET